LKKNLTCASAWYNGELSLHHKIKTNVMKNNEIDLNALSLIISSDTSFNALLGIINDMDLEIEGIRTE
jgi:hypothetical protein